MALILEIDGEDAGSTPWEFDSIFESNGCVFALNAGAKAHGDYGYRFTADGVGQNGYGVKAFTEQAEVYARFYINVPSILSAGSTTGRMTVLMLRDGSVNVMGIGIAFNSGNPWTWSIYDYYTGYQTASADHYTEDEWHYLEMHWRKTGPIIDWREDGENLDSSSYSPGGAYDIDNIRFGWYGYSEVLVPDANDYLDLDTLELNTAGWIGAYVPVGGSSLAERRRRYIN